MGQPVSYEIVVATETAQQVASAILGAAGDVMTPLGDRDPNAICQVATGFVLAIDAINRNIDPRFRTLVTEMLRAK